MSKLQQNGGHGGSRFTTDSRSQGGRSFSILNSQMMASEAILSDDNLRAILDKKVQKIQTAFDRKVKDMKPFLLDQACAFIRQ